jgi:hypothetical protein
MEKKSPFQFGNIVSDEEFTNREDVRFKLKTNLTMGINTLLISPRRWGKSSLVERTIKDIKAENKNFIIVTLDLFNYASIEDFLSAYADEIVKASSNKLKEVVNLVKKIFKQIIPKVGVSIDGQSEFSISFDYNQIQKHQNEILNLPELIAVEKNCQLIICIDEFQQIANYRDFEDFEKKLRAIWQKHKNVTYCLYGSKKNMMINIFNNPSKPFYRFGDIIFLDKIKNQDWVIFLIQRFKAFKKNISEEDASYLAKAVENHSWYVQQVAFYCYVLSKTDVSKEIILLALKEVINTNLPLYQKMMDGITSAQLGLLQAIYKNETQLTSVEVMQNYRLGTPANVKKNLNKLINNEMIDKASTREYIFLDPAFRYWFGQTFFSESLNSILTKAIAKQ